MISWQRIWRQGLTSWTYVLSMSSFVGVAWTWGPWQPRDQSQALSRFPQSRSLWHTAGPASIGRSKCVELAEMNGLADSSKLQPIALIMHHWLCLWWQWVLLCMAIASLCYGCVTNKIETHLWIYLCAFSRDLWLTDIHRCFRALLQNKDRWD